MPRLTWVPKTGPVLWMRTLRWKNGDLLKIPRLIGKPGIYYHSRFRGHWAKLRNLAFRQTRNSPPLFSSAPPQTGENNPQDLRPSQVRSLLPDASSARQWLAAFSQLARGHP